jgi:hypothetical protein
MIGMIGHAQLRKSRPCCNAGKKLHSSVRRPYLKVSLNRFISCTFLCCPVFFFFFWAVRSSAYKLIDSIFSNPYQRYGETVGAHQWAMKVSSKKDHNGLIIGCLQSRGTIAAEHEPQLIKETPSKL